MAKKVLVIDDSAYSRRTLKSMLEAIPDVKFVSTAVDGVDGLRQALRLQPDLIMLDLEMPNMDGFTFLRLLSGAGRRVPVVAISGRHGDDGAMAAFKLGASDFIKKPSILSSRALSSIGGEIEKAVRLSPYRRCAKAASRVGSGDGAFASATEAVVIGASTGGPAAVTTIIKALPASLSACVAVAVHMPQWLSAAFAERLSAVTPLRVRIAADGERIEKGVVVVAPGGSHLSFIGRKGGVYSMLTRGRTTDIHVPSIDRMFSSAASVWGDNLTGVILSGMGSDGKRGVVDIKDRGGFVIAESEESAPVSSMPSAAVATGKVDMTLPSEGIGRWLSDKSMGPGEEMRCLSGNALKKRRLSGMLT